MLLDGGNWRRPFLFIAAPAAAALNKRRGAHNRAWLLMPFLASLCGHGRTSRTALHAVPTSFC